MGNFLLDEKWCMNRYRNTNCELCRQVCPQKAITDEGIVADKCNDCGLCAAVCPTNAMAAKVMYHEALAGLIQGAKIHLACKKNQKTSRLPCLAIIDSRLLLALAQQHIVTLDIAGCAACEPSIAAILQERLLAANKVLAKQEKTAIECRVTSDDPPEDKIVGRRDLFKSLFGVMVHVAATINADKLSPTFIRCDFTNLIGRELPETMEFTALVDKPHLSITEQKCNGCGLCVKLCPQKALQGERVGSNFILQYKAYLCLQCGICHNNCRPKAISFTMDPATGDQFIGELPCCESCGEPYQPIADSKICFTCFAKQRLL